MDNWRIWFALPESLNVLNVVQEMGRITLHGRVCKQRLHEVLKRRNKQPCDVTGSWLLPQRGQSTGNGQRRSATPRCCYAERGNRGRERRSTGRDREREWVGVIDGCDKEAEAGGAVEHQSCCHESVLSLSKQDLRSHGWHVSKGPVQREATATHKVSEPVNLCEWLIIQTISTQVTVPDLIFLRRHGFLMYHGTVVVQTNILWTCTTSYPRGFNLFNPVC